MNFSGRYIRNFNNVVYLASDGPPQPLGHRHRLAGRHELAGGHAMGTRIVRSGHRP